MARAYGIAERRIAMRYALRPALIPTLTILGLDIAAKLGNAFLVETVFGWPGMARYGVQAILHKDLNGVVGTVLVIAAFFLIINIIVDVAVSLLDPRIRLGTQAA
jgi:peptide/nickel transport system permease protein